MSDLGGADVEALVRVMSDLEPAEGEERHARTLFERRLHLAKGPDDRIELFIEGARQTFGFGAVGRGLAFDQFRDRTTSRCFDAVLIRSVKSPRDSIRPMAHLAYEAVQRLLKEPEISNEELIRDLQPYLQLVVSRELLSQEQQLGLTGELLLLKELLNVAERDQISKRQAVESWTGWSAASRDFKFGAVALEVKVAQSDRRSHWVHSMYQLLAAQGDCERVYVYSLGMRIDQSRTFCLLTQVDKILAALDGPSADLFLERASEYCGVGFSLADRRRYELEPGFLVVRSPAMIRVDNLADILRPESFARGELPARVGSIQYRVQLDGLPILTGADRKDVLRALLGVQD